MLSCSAGCCSSLEHPEKTITEPQALRERRVIRFARESGHDAEKSGGCNQRVSIQNLKPYTLNPEPQSNSYNYNLKLYTIAPKASTFQNSRRSLVML